MAKILFVDEDKTFLKAYTSKFLLEGFQVETVSSGEIALNRIRNNHPDCIILDIMLGGGLNGFDVLEIIKKDSVLSKIPILILSNLESETKIAKEIGIDSYLIKTETDPMEVVQVVKKILKIQ